MNPLELLELRKTMYLGFDEDSLSRLLEPKKVVKFKNDEYLSLKLFNFKGIQYTVYHKLFEFFGTVQNPKIAFYIYSDCDMQYLALLKSLNDTPDWFHKFVMDSMIKNHPEYFL